MDYVRKITSPVQAVQSVGKRLHGLFIDCRGSQITFYGKTWGRINAQFAYVIRIYLFCKIKPIELSVS